MITRVEAYVCVMNNYISIYKCIERKKLAFYHPMHNIYRHVYKVLIYGI